MALSEILKELIRPEVGMWKVRKSSGSLVEAFDPLTLLNSLIESEVPIDDAFDILDRSLERLAAFSDPYTHEQIQSCVQQALLDCPKPESNTWFSNYDNIYGPDLDALGDEAGLVWVRSETDFRKIIEQILPQLTGVESPEELRDQLGANELKTISERFVRLIRHCGFYKVRHDFLVAFCKEISMFSTKGILPRTRSNSGEEMERMLDDAERLVLSAKEVVSSNPCWADHNLNLALELSSREALSKYGLVLRTSSRGCFEQFTRFLRDMNTLLKSEKAEAKKLYFPELASIRNEMSDALAQNGVPLQRFLNYVFTLEKNYRNGRYSLACEEAERYVRNLRVMLLPDTGFNRLRNFELGKSVSTMPYLNAIVDTWESLGNLGNASSGADYVDIDIDYDYHRLVSFGRKVRIRTRFEGENTAGHLFSRCPDDISESDDLIPVLVVDKDLDQSEIKNLRKIVAELRRCISVLSRPQLEGALRRTDALRDTILDKFERLVGKREFDWHDLVFETEERHVPLQLPDRLAPYQIRTLQDAHDLIVKGKAYLAGSPVSALLESSTADHLYLIYSILRYGVRNPPETKLFLEEPRGGLGDILRRLIELNNITNRQKEWKGFVSKLLLSQDAIRKLEALRADRNLYAHELPSIGAYEANLFIKNSAHVLSMMETRRDEFRRGRIVESSPGFTIVDTERERMKFEGKRRCSKELDKTVGTFCFVVKRPGIFPLIPALHRCAMCNSLTRMASSKRETHWSCECGQESKLDVAWSEIKSGQ